MKIPIRSELAQRLWLDYNFRKIGKIRDRTRPVGVVAMKVRFPYFSYTVYCIQHIFRIEEKSIALNYSRHYNSYDKHKVYENYSINRNDE